jgi:hypothetical protein
MNFDRIASGLDVAPLVAELDAHPELWSEITVRQDYPGSAHHDTECIFLRGPRGFTMGDYMGDVVAYDYPAMDRLADLVVPLITPVLKGLGVTELGYVLIVRLSPGGHVDEHIDEGAYADHYSRFHLALTGSPGATLTVGDERQHFAPGDCWWFNHKATHSADNNAGDWRIHVIFDAVTPRYQVHVPG